MRSFLGLANYFREHIRDFAVLAKHLTEPQREAFEIMKRAISNCPTIFFLDQSSPVFLHTDASKYAIGGYLFQLRDNKEYPIAFVSHLIRDIPFTLRTDHKNLIGIRDSGSEKVLRWKLAIQEFNFVVEHIEGPRNVVADALSRLVVPAEHNDKKRSNRVADDD